MNGDDYGVFLMPPEYNTGRTHAFFDKDDPLGFMRARYSFVADDVKDITGKFEKLQQTIRDYMLNCCLRSDGKVPIVEYLLQFEAKGKKK